MLIFKHATTHSPLENADINMVETNERETDSALNLRPLDNFMLSSMAQSTDLNAKEGELTDQSKNHFRVRSIRCSIVLIVLVSCPDESRCCGTERHAALRRYGRCTQSECESTYALIARMSVNTISSPHSQHRQCVVVTRL